MKRFQFLTGFVSVLCERLPGVVVGKLVCPCNHQGCANANCILLVRFNMQE